MTPHPVPMDAIVVATTEQVSCDAGEETVVLSLREGIYYGLNPVAAFVWKQIQQETTVEAIRDRMMEEYDVAQDVCTSDLHALIEQLSSWNLIEIRNGKRNTNPSARSGNARGRS